jgi:hypothetical protein
MVANFFKRWLSRVWIPPLVLASMTLATLGPAFPAGSPAGQLPERAQLPSPVPGAVPAPGRPSVLDPNTMPNISVGPQLNRKQKNALIMDNFKRTKNDVAKLSRLVRSLQQAINKSNANILSVSIVKQANNIEKLAKRIKSETKGY